MNTSTPSSAQSPFHAPVVVLEDGQVILGQTAVTVRPYARAQVIPAVLTVMFDRCLQVGVFQSLDGNGVGSALSPIYLVRPGADVVFSHLGDMAIESGDIESGDVTAIETVARQFLALDEDGRVHQLLAAYHRSQDDRARRWPAQAALYDAGMDATIDQLRAAFRERHLKRTGVFAHLFSARVEQVTPDEAQTWRASAAHTWTVRDGEVLSWGPPVEPGDQIITSTFDRVSMAPFPAFTRVEVTAAQWRVAL